MAGVDQIALTLAHLPAHTHQVATDLSVTGTAHGTIVPKCFNEQGEASSPANNVLANVGNGYMTSNESDATMAPIPASLVLDGSVEGSITVQETGNPSSSLHHMPPVTVINWIICLTGDFPSRN